MANDNITIFLQGKEGDESNLIFRRFVGLLRTIQIGLSKTDMLLNNNKSTLDYKIVHITHSSPYAIELKAIQREKNIKTSEKVINTFINNILTIEKQEIAPENFDYELYQTLRNLGTLRERYFSEITFKNTNNEVTTSKNLKYHVDKAIGEDIENYGSFVGMLERLNIHNKANKFYIYPCVGPDKIECKFPESLVDKAKEGIGRNVEVFGKLKYKATQNFPHYITVDEVNIYPKDEDLPSLDELKGIEPTLTGEETTQKFLDRIRSDYEE